MQNLRALSVGGVISVAAVSLFAQAEAGTGMRPANIGAGASLLQLAQAKDAPAWAAEAKMNPDYKPGAPTSESKSSDERSSTGAGIAKTITTPPPAPASGPKPAWAAEATMNPDYKPGDTTAAPAAAAEAPAPAEEPAAAPPAAPAAAPAGGPKPAWAEDAKMNPDYKRGEIPAAPAASAVPATAPAGATDAAASSGSKPAWAADAKMNPDYKPGEVPATPAAAAAAPAALPSASGDPAVAYCTKALSGEDTSGKILFGPGSSDIAASSHATLKKIAKLLQECGDVTIEVGGYTDNVGSSGGNKSLSEERAKAVAEYLTSAGVETTKLKAVGHGDERPIASNDTAEGRKMNRRIEFAVSGK